MVVETHKEFIFTPAAVITCGRKTAFLISRNSLAARQQKRKFVDMKHKLTLPLILVLAPLSGAHAFAGIQFSVKIAPPPIAVFDQSPCPGDGYIWTPGYYQYGDYGYYWVPGQWVIPPSVGLLWTPGYWGFGGGRYAWHEGYWGPQVGFYGGINYRSEE